MNKKASVFIIGFMLVMTYGLIAKDPEDNERYVVHIVPDANSQRIHDGDLLDRYQEIVAHQDVIIFIKKVPLRIVIEEPATNHQRGRKAVLHILRQLGLKTYTPVP